MIVIKTQSAFAFIPEFEPFDESVLVELVVAVSVPIIAGAVLYF